MKNKIVWLRISYWAGAIGDFLIAILALVPKRMGVPSYCYPMGLLSAVAFSWGCMLIWADRKPLERKWILLPTILVVIMLATAEIYSALVGAISFSRILPFLIFQPLFIVLMSFSYYNARNAE